MIFVTVGTSTFPFDRLLQGVDQLRLEEELVVQYGASAVVPRAGITQQFMPYAKVLDHMRHARAVIAHAGAGSILTALYAGTHPIVVPRRRAFAEAVDDHQFELAARLARKGVVTMVDDVSKLHGQLAAIPDAAPALTTDSSLAVAVRELVDRSLAEPDRA
jgi:UDP-N-acetylglucosamine transferase subunit ALG13